MGAHSFASDHVIPLAPTPHQGPRDFSVPFRVTADGARRRHKVAGPVGSGTIVRAQFLESSPTSGRRSE
eukprot:4807882-Prymnesium_polylepis.1